MKLEYIIATLSIMVAVSSLIVAYELSIVIQHLQTEINRIRGTISDIKKTLNRLKSGVHGIVYILPYNACSRYWYEHYGDRIFFYAYSNISRYAHYIDSDFNIIRKVYDTVIIIIPAENSSLFFYNLRQIDLISRKHSLKVLWTIFPKWKFGDEKDYLEPGTRLNIVLLRIMDYLATLNSTWKIAIWYGWRDRADVSDIVMFYNSLTPKLKQFYALWLDQPYVYLTEKLVTYDPKFLIITELYSEDFLKKYACIVPNQMIITGYPNARSIEEWLMGICKKLMLIRDTKHLGIWIYYDINDGSGERYAAYFENEGLVNPWVCLINITKSKD